MKELLQQKIFLWITIQKIFCIVFKCKKQKFYFLRIAQLHCLGRICQLLDWTFRNDFKSLHQHVILCGSNFHGFFFCAWPTESANIQSLVKKKEPISFPNQPFDSVGTFTTEEKQDVFLKGIQFELIFDGGCQTVNPTP